MNSKPTLIRLSHLLILGQLLAAVAATAQDRPVQSFELPGVADQTTSIDFSGDLKWLAVHQMNGQIAIWNLVDGKRTASWPAEGGVTFTSLTNVLVAEGTNLAIREMLTGQVLRQLESPTDSPSFLTASGSGDFAAGTVGMPRQLVLWDLAAGKIMQHLPTERYPWESGMRVGARPPMLPVSMSAGLCRAFSPDGKRFAVGQDSAQVDVWTLVGSNYSRYLGTVSGPGTYGMSTSGRAESLAFLDNQRLAVAYNRERLVVLTLNTNDAEIMQTLPRMVFTAKTSESNVLTGEVVADASDRAATQLRRLGLSPMTMRFVPAGKRNYSYQVTNSVGWPIVGATVASSIEEASAEFEKRGLRYGKIIETPDDSVTVESRKRAMQEIIKQHPDWALLQKLHTLIVNPGLEIRSLAASGDGRRLAVAGMRMAWRRGVFAPAGDGVYDVPVNAELQVWDAVEMKLLATIKGRPDEKFGQVALDESGRRVAAVTTGVTYNSRTSGAQQQGMELSPTSPRRVYVWEVPTGKTGSN